MCPSAGVCVCVSHFMRAVASSPSHVSLRKGFALFHFAVFFSFSVVAKNRTALEVFRKKTRKALKNLKPVVKTSDTRT